MMQAVWLALNILVGVPAALVLLSVARESLRAVVGLALGFRVFEIQLGLGRRRFATPLGPIDFAVAALPLGGATVAASGSPRRHRSARIALASAPAIAQLTGLAILERSGALDPDWGQGLMAGPAPLGAFVLANLLLLVIHCLLPLEGSLGIPTDIRALLDAGFGRPASSRRVRAEYYARLARHRLERGDVVAAREAVAGGLVQLGREPLLVECQAALTRGDLESVIDQGESAEVLHSLIEAARDASDEGRNPGLRERIRWKLIRALPLAIGLLLLVAWQRVPLARALHSSLVDRGEAVAATGDAVACGAALARWRISGLWLERLLSGDPDVERDAAARRAGLESCRGDLEAALTLQTRAVEAAEEACRHWSARADHGRWLDSELRFLKALRDSAALEHAQHRFQRALAALARAERRVDDVGRRVTDWPEADSRTDALAVLLRERGQILEARSAVLEGTRRMAGRP